MEDTDSRRDILTADFGVNVGTHSHSFRYSKQIVDAGGDPVKALIYVTQAFAEAGAQPNVPPADVAALTLLERDNKLSATQAKTVLAEIVANGGGDAAAIAAAKEQPRHLPGHHGGRRRRCSRASFTAAGSGNGRT